MANITVKPAKSSLSVQTEKGFWLYRLKAGETLPRGRFFRKRKPIINVMAVVHDASFEK
ncbi:hypothetical protein [Klebsiella pneumoniae]|uniref:hypothetical protein n=1 Tax=Klebsiella pneumoniae TaxID=573 RepID=UPI0013F179B1|nr:hypothetical protein [Klebsiella pneumoniae]